MSKVNEMLQHDNDCGVWWRPARCTCGEWTRNPELWRIIYPQAYVATLEAARERRAYSEHVAMSPVRRAIGVAAQA